MLFKHPTLNYYEITFAWTTQTAEIARDERGWFICFIDVPAPDGLGLRESGPHDTFKAAYKLVAQYFIHHRKMMTCRAPEHGQTPQDEHLHTTRTGNTSSPNPNKSRNSYDGDLLQAL